MVDGSLSQEEIDLLLQGADDFSGQSQSGDQAGAAAQLGQDMSPLERETVADLLHQSLREGAQGLGMILGRHARIGQPYAEGKDQGGIEREFKGPFVAFTQNLSGGLNGTIGLFIPAPDAAKISAVVMGNEDTIDPEQPLDSAQIATVKDALNSLVFTIAGQMGARIRQPVTPMPVEVRMASDEPFPLRDAPNYLKIQMPFSVENAVDSRIHLVLPLSMAAEIYQKSRQQGGGAPGGMPGEMGMPQQPQGPQPGQAGIKDVNFPNLSSGAPAPSQPNMSLLMDVQMTLTVELGRTKMYIKEILGLGEGSIIELDKLAGEPVDLLVNGKLIAKGEVVVIDENFGVRVTDIVSPVDRLKNKNVQQ